MFDGWLMIQLQDQCSHVPIETNLGSATFTSIEMQVANRKQTLKSLNHLVPWKFVSPTPKGGTGSAGSAVGAFGVI
jgi:hypothetical protein